MAAKKPKLSRAEKYAQSHNKRKRIDLFFIPFNIAASLFAAFLGAYMIGLNSLINDTDNYFFAFFIGGFWGSVLTATFRSLLRRRHCYNIYYIVLAALSTFLLSGSISFILHALTLTNLE